MKILVACEESQTVCKAFRARGHEAYSADIQEPSGGHPEWHIQGDVRKFINPDVLFPGELPAWYADAWKLPKVERAKLRSKTFPGIAEAMAEQWGVLA